ALAENLVRNSGTLLKEEVRDFALGPGGPTHVITDKARHAVDAVALTGGAWSKALSRKLGHRPLPETERGYHVMVPKPGFARRLPIYPGEYTCAVTPLEHGLRIAGTVELGGLEAPPNYARARVLLERGRRMFPQLQEAGKTEWMGFRP